MIGILRQWAFTVGWAVVVVTSITVIAATEDGVVVERPVTRVETEIVTPPPVTVTAPPPETLPLPEEPPPPTGGPTSTPTPQPSPTSPSSTPTSTPPGPTPHNRALGLADACVVPQRGDPDRYLIIPCHSVQSWADTRAYGTSPVRSYKPRWVHGQRL